MKIKKFIRPNQIIITALAVMIAVAGYVNYSGKLFGNKNNKNVDASEASNQELLDISEEDINTAGKDIESVDSQETAEGEDASDGTPGEAVLTNAEAKGTIAQAKVNREQVRSQNKETLQQLIDNESISEEQKTAAIEQMTMMTTLAEQEVDIETLLEAKGFSEVVVNLTQDSADVVVNAAELSDASRAQIEDVVTRKSDVAPENIVITQMK